MHSFLEPRYNDDNNIWQNKQTYIHIPKQEIFVSTQSWNDLSLNRKYEHIRTINTHRIYANIQLTQKAWTSRISKTSRTYNPKHPKQLTGKNKDIKTNEMLIQSKVEHQNEFKI